MSDIDLSPDADDDPAIDVCTDDGAMLSITCARDGVVHYDARMGNGEYASGSAYMHELVFRVLEQALREQAPKPDGGIRSRRAARLTRAERLRSIGLVVAAMAALAGLVLIAHFSGAR